MERALHRRALPGLLLPGLGHLLRGRWLTGTALVLESLVLVWGAVSGFPRLGTLLSTDPADGGFRLHPWVALASWLVALVLLERAAWRQVRPASPREGRRHVLWEDFKRQFQRNRAGVLGLHMTLLLVLVTLVTPLIAPYDPLALDVGGQRIPPQPGHWMGTDEFGRDLLSRVLYGARLSLAIGFLAVSISATVGTTVGAVAGYFGGTVDRLLMWITDLLLSLPRLVLLLAIVGFLRVSGVAAIAVLVLILGLTGWMGVARIVRSQVLSIKEQDYVQAGRALGLSNARLLVVHILPNTLAPIIVYASLAIGTTILVEAALSFLGLGVPPPTPTWGAIVNDGRESMRSAPWITIFPGLMIVWAVMAFNLLGDGLRDALDPRMRGRA